MRRFPPVLLGLMLALSLLGAGCSQRALDYFFHLVGDWGAAAKPPLAEDGRPTAAGAGFILNGGSTNPEDEKAQAALDADETTRKVKEAEDHAQNGSIAAVRGELQEAEENVTKAIALRGDDYIYRNQRMAYRLERTGDPTSGLFPADARAGEAVCNADDLLRYNSRECRSMYKHRWAAFETSIQRQEQKVGKAHCATYREAEKALRNFDSMADAQFDKQMNRVYLDTYTEKMRQHCP
jgi:hypothetical protein